MRHAGASWVWVPCLPLIPLLSGAVASGPTVSDKRIDVSISCANVATAVRALAQGAGVPLAVDHSLGRRPFQLFIRNQPLHAVRGSLARALATPPGTCLWVRGTFGGRTGYRLIEDARSRAARVTRLKKLAAQRRQRLDSDFFNALELSRLSDEELEQVRARYPDFGHWMPTMRSTFGLLASLTPEQRSLVFSGDGVNLPYREMTPPQQELLYGMVGGRRRSRLTFPNSNPPTVREWRSPEDLPKSASRSGSPVV